MFIMFNADNIRTGCNKSMSLKDFFKKYEFQSFKKIIFTFIICLVIIIIVVVDCGEKWGMSNAYW